MHHGGVPELVGEAVEAGRLASQSQPTLRIDELTVRPWRTSDIPAVVEAYGDREIQHWHSRTMTTAEAGAWVASWPARWTAETGAGWAVTRDDALVGRVGFRTISLAEGCAEAAYWTTAAARGSNVAARALTLVSTWMFRHVGLHRLELNHSVANPASCRVATKAGYLAEGTRARQALHPDGWHDMHMHALIAARDT